MKPDIPSAGNYSTDFLHPHSHSLPIPLNYLHLIEGVCVVIGFIRQVVVDNQPKKVLFVANAGDAAAILK